jgi:hypothetical protein
MIPLEIGGYTDAAGKFHATEVSIISVGRDPRVGIQPVRRVTIDPRSEVSPSYWYVDGLAVPRTELGRRYLEAAYREDEANGFDMSYELLCEKDGPT